MVLQAKGLSYFEIGVLNSFGAFISILSEVPTGRLADTFGQKYALTAGAIFTALGLSVLALADSVLLIYVSEGVTGIGLALSSGADSAWLFTEHRRLGREDEYLRTRSVIGSISMPFSIGANALAPVLLSWSTSSPVWISAVLYCLAAGIWARLAVHRRDEDSSRVQHRRQEVDLPPCLRLRIERCVASLIGMIGANGLFLCLASISTFVMIAVSNFETYVGPFLQEQGLEVRMLGIALVLGSLARWFAVRNVFRLARPTDVQRIRVIGAVALGILLMVAMSAMVRSAWVGVAAYVGMSGMSSCFYILVDEQVNRIAIDRFRATALSVVSMLDELSTIVVDPGIGLLLDRLGFGASYLLTGAVLASCVLVATAIAVRLLPKRGAHS